MVFLLSSICCASLLFSAIFLPKVKGQKEGQQQVETSSVVSHPPVSIPSPTPQTTPTFSPSLSSSFEEEKGEKDYNKNLQDGKLEQLMRTINQELKKGEK